MMFFIDGSKILYKSPDFHRLLSVSLWPLGFTADTFQYSEYFVLNLSFQLSKKQVIQLLFILLYFLFFCLILINDLTVWIKEYAGETWELSIVFLLVFRKKQRNCCLQAINFGSLPDKNNTLDSKRRVKYILVLESDYPFAESFNSFQQILEISLAKMPLKINWFYLF